MQAILQPELAARIATVIRVSKQAAAEGRDATAEERRLVTYAEPDVHALADYKQLIKRLIAYKGVRNPKSWRDAFQTIDDANDGHKKRNSCNM